ncbi:unnamed protein product [Citrullus colocynthis]|uniref:Uncharacterized protein n=1 Tax=Citrullus colocynthis TaxID=252529 RepID=A0ABP0Z338_9ROSI
MFKKLIGRQWNPPSKTGAPSVALRIRQRLVLEQETEARDSGTSAFFIKRSLKRLLVYEAELGLFHLCISVEGSKR